MGPTMRVETHPGRRRLERGTMRTGTDHQSDVDDATPAPGSRVAELRFRAMGADAHVIVVGGSGELAVAVRERIDDLERRWSRFLPDSEVNELNRCSGQPLMVSPETAQLVERATQAWRITGGSFDATVLGDVIRAGYDRPFDEVA